MRPGSDHRKGLSQDLRQRLEGADGEYLFRARLYAAVKRRDAWTIRDLAKWAGIQRQPWTVRSLCDVLMPPSPDWRTPVRSSHGWTEARGAAVWALNEIGDPAALPALARTLACTPCPIVREAARAAISSFGRMATSYLVG